VPNSPNTHPDSPAGAGGPGFFRNSRLLGNKTGLDPWNSTRGPLGHDPLDRMATGSGQSQLESLQTHSVKLHSGLRVPPSTLAQLFRGNARPAGLSDWDDRVSNWCDEYASKSGGAELSEISVEFAVFVFDHTLERVVVAYAVSVTQLMKRDSSRMQGFLRGKKTEKTFRESVQETLKDKTFVADKGHFLGHASGGILEINLFPQRAELNEGHSVEGVRFRKMERYVEEHPGTFFYHRPIYDDESWIPQLLQYGVLKDGTHWWEDQFANK
jgi:hypothetical protein